MTTPTYDLITSITVTNTSTASAVFTGFSTSYRHLVVIAAAGGIVGVNKWTNEASLWWTSNTFQTRMRYSDYSGDFWYTNITSPVYSWFPGNGHGGGYQATDIATNTYGVKYVSIPRYNDTVQHAVYNDGNEIFVEAVPDFPYAGSMHTTTTSTNAVTRLEIGSQAATLTQGSTYFVYGLKSA